MTMMTKLVDQIREQLRTMQIESETSVDVVEPEPEHTALPVGALEVEPFPYAFEEAIADMDFRTSETADEVAMCHERIDRNEEMNAQKFGVMAGSLYQFFEVLYQLIDEVEQLKQQGA